MSIQLATVSDNDLERTLVQLVAGERAATVELIVHLAEFDARRLYLGAGFASLFTYCCSVLRLSEGEAYNRIEAARLGRRFPQVLDLLRTGSLNMTTARLLAPHLTDGNQSALLAMAAGKSKREVEELVAAQFPCPAGPASVRKLPVARRQAEALPGCADQAAGVAVDRPLPAPRVADPSPPVPSRRPEVMPVAADLYQVKFAASASTREKLRAAQDLLRHAIPSGDLGEIIDRALTALLDTLARKKFAATKRPREGKVAPARSRDVPAAIRRAVWARDGGRCAFVGKQDRRCHERGFLEFHHVDPYILDSTASVDGIELRCRAHNAYESMLYFGPWQRGPDAGPATRPGTRSGTSP